MVGVFLSFNRWPNGRVSKATSATPPGLTWAPPPSRLNPEQPKATPEMLIAAILAKVQPPPVFCWAPSNYRVPKFSSKLPKRLRQHTSIIDKLDETGADKRTMGQRIEDSALFVAFLTPTWAGAKDFHDQIKRFARAHGQPSDDNTLLLEAEALGGTPLPPDIRGLTIQPFRCTYQVEDHRASIKGRGFVPHTLISQNQNLNLQTNVVAAVTRLSLMIYAAERGELETTMQAEIKADIRAESDRSTERIAALKRDLPDRDVFISYRSSDEEWAKWIEEVLKRAGLTTFVMFKDMKAGRSFQDIMFAAIEKAEIFLALFSPEYFSDGSYCPDEYQIAVDRQKHNLNRQVIGIKVAECEPPRQYTIRHYINLSNEPSSARAAKQILEAVGKLDAVIEVPSGWPGG